jgi:hypothetical protein
MDNLTEIMGDEILTENVIVVPQIVEENGLIFEQTNENGCISRIQIGVVIPKVLDELGEVIEEERIEPIIPEPIQIAETIEERIDTLAEKVEQLEQIML